MPVMKKPIDFLRGALPRTPQAPKKEILGLNGPLNLPSPPPLRINDPSGKLSGSYDRDLLRSVSDQARLEGVDPLTALAVSGQESTFGRFDDLNPLQLDFNVHGVPEGLDAISGRDRLIQKSLNYFKARTDRQRRQTPNDEALILQSYNGMGRVPDGHYEEGSQMTGRKDKPYGKAVMGIRDLLKSNPEVLKLIKGK